MSTLQLLRVSPRPRLHTPAAGLTPPPPLLALFLVVVTQIMSLETLSGYSLIFLNLKNEHLNSLKTQLLKHLLRALVSRSVAFLPWFLEGPGTISDGGVSPRLWYSTDFQAKWILPFWF